MNKYVIRHLFGTELKIGLKNLTSEEWIYFWIKCILLIGFTTFLFMLGANMWLTLFGVDFQFIWWTALIAIFALGTLFKESGFVISVVVGVSGLLLFPFI